MERQTKNSQNKCDFMCDREFCCFIRLKTCLKYWRHKELLLSMKIHFRLNAKPVIWSRKDRESKHQKLIE